MKKTVRYSMTVLLVFVMLLALLVPTFANTANAVGEVAAGAAGTPESAVGSNDVGWLKVTYTDNKISVVVRPDTTELKGITLGELKSILKTMLEGAIEVTLEDVKDSFIGSEYGDDFKSITVAEAVELALDNYVADKYDGADDDDKYFSFLKASLADVNNVYDFADYVCKLLRDVIKMGFLDKDDLIPGSEVAVKLDTIFDDGFDTRVNARVEAYMQEYFDWIEGKDSTPDIEASVLSHVNGLTADYVRDEAERAMSSAYDPNDQLQTIIQKYINKNKGNEFVDVNGEIIEGKEIDVLFACLNEVKNDDPATYDKILAIVEAEADREVHLGSTVDKVVEEYLGVESKAALEAKKDEYVEIIVAKYEDTVAKIKADGDAVMSLEDFVTCLETVTVTTEEGVYPLLINDPVNGAMVYRDGLVDFFNSLPTLDELAVTADADMIWEFGVSIGTTYGDCVFDIVLSVGDETDSESDRATYCSRVRRAAGKLAEYVDYSIDKTNTIALSVNVPQIFSKAVLAGLNSSSAPDYLKRQVYALFSLELNDITDEIDTLTFAQLIDVLEDIDFEDVLSREEIKQFVDLTDITNEGIVNKVKGYEKSFGEIKDLIVRFLRKVPAEYQNKSIIDFYLGDGAFDYNGTHEVDLEGLLNRITEKYGSRISAFFGEEFNRVTLDLNVTFADVRKITYTSDGTNAISTGVLPTGANVAFFAPEKVLDANGNEITFDYWADAATGEPVEKMPDYDVVLKPVTVTVLPTLEWDYTSDFTYDGQSHKVVVKDVPAGFTVEYIYTDANGNSVTDVVNAGTYTVSAVVKNAAGEVVGVELAPLTYKVAPAKVDLSSAAWSGSEFTYNGTEQGVKLDVTGLLGNLPESILVYTGNTAIRPDTYTATVKCVLSAEYAGNYEVILPAATTHTWVINPGVIDMSGVTVSGVTYNYDGRWRTVNVSGVPANVRYEALSYRLPGEYNIEVKFVYTGSDADCYAPIAPMSATLVIREVVPALQWNYTADFNYDGASHKVVVKSVPDGFTVEYTYKNADGNVVADVVNAGTYTVSAVVKNVIGEVINVDLAPLTYKINPRVVDLSGVNWTASEFNYNGREKSVKLNVGSLLGNLPESILVYTGNKATIPGTYTATVECVLPAEYVGNCTVILPAATTHTWVINLGVINMSGVTVTDNTVFYDGRWHTVNISALPAGVEARYDSYNLPGEYDIVVEFVYTGADADYYEPIAPMSAKLVIKDSLPTFEWDYTADFTYDGQSHNVAVKNVPDGFTVEYTYRNSAGEIVTDVINVGTYTVSAVVKNAIGEIVDAELAPLTYKIDALVVDLSGATWVGSEFYYDGTEHKVFLNVEGLLGNLPESILAYADNAATRPGTYTATVECVLPDEYVGNCIVILPDNTSHEWVINLGIIDMSGVTVTDNTVEYDGGWHTVNISTLPAGVEARYESYNLPGEYDIVVEFVYTGEDADCYEALASMSAKLVITGTVPDVPEIPELEWDYTEDFTYDGQPHNVGIKELPDGFTVEYVYTDENGDVVTDVINAGSYTVSIVVKNAAGEVVPVELAPLTYKVDPTVIDLSGAAWSGSEFGYNGSEHRVELDLGDLVGSLPADLLLYTDNVAKMPGTYTVTVAVNTSYAGNYVVILPENTSHDWTVSIGTIDMSGVTVTDTTVDYDGGWHTVNVSGLPEGVEAKSATYRFPGEYEVIVEFVYTGSDADCYAELAPMSAKLVIVGKYNTTYEYRDPVTDEVVISIEAEAGLLADVKLAAENHSYVYRGFDLPDGKYGKVIVAYDISFIQDGIIQDVTDTFTVKMLIPESKRSNDNLEMVCVAPDGSVEVLESEVEGDYLKFTTTHFSVYSIVEAGDPIVAPEAPDLTWLWILLIVLGCLVVVGAIILVIILIKRKKDGDEPTEPTEEPAPTEPTDDGGEADVAEEAPAEEAPAEQAPEEEAPAEQAPAEEAPAEPEKKHVVFKFAEEGDEDVDADGDVVLVRFRTSFESRFIQSDAEIQDYYTEIKNALLSYKGVKARTSWNYESFNKARIQCAKLNIKGSALLVYLGLDPANYNANKYHFTDMSDKPKFEKVPMLMKVKSERALKYTLELIEEMMKSLDIPMGDPQNVDYRLPYETTEALAARGLVKVILPAGMTLDDDTSIIKVDVGAHIASEGAKEADEAPVEAPAVEEAPAEAHVVVEAPADIHVDIIAPEDVVYVDAEHADEILTNDEAVAKIEVIHTGASKRTGKLVAVNLDTICANYESGETVNITTLKEKGLIPANAARVKILARGVMTKALTVVASKYSIPAVKMIYLAGGLAELED